VSKDKIKSERITLSNLVSSLAFRVKKSISYMDVGMLVDLFPSLYEPPPISFSGLTLRAPGFDSKTPSARFDCIVRDSQAHALACTCVPYHTNLYFCISIHFYLCCSELP